jgi:hypothetical protein
MNLQATTRYGGPTGQCMQLPDDTEDCASEPGRFLRCSVCHHVLPISRREMLAFVNSKWPCCCGEVMILHLELLGGAIQEDKEHR